MNISQMSNLIYAIQQKTQLSPQLTYQKENNYIICHCHLQFSSAKCKYISYINSLLIHMTGCAAWARSSWEYKERE